MKLDLSVKVDDVYHVFSFLNGCNFDRLYYPGHFLIYVYKVHNHLYYYKAFFYKSLHIYSNCYYNSKTKLFCAVQNLLEQELYHVVQF